MKNEIVNNESLTISHFGIPYARLSIIVILLGVIVRLISLGKIPGGLNQDEAFAGYEAYCLLQHGADSFGYSFPMYLTAWGSGMNALNSYLMIPFIAIFGLQTWVIRLPQALVACFSLWVLWLLLRRSFDDFTAFWGTFFLTICPWHIMLSRWGLESNLAPGFLLFGLYFFQRGIENSKFFLLSAFCYGMSLYCYATIWPVVPLILLLQTFYLLWIKSLKIDHWFIVSVLLLALLAAPAFLFLLVNKEILPEIRTPLLSIPKLLYMRDNEISLNPVALLNNWRNTFHMLIQQNDGLYWNCTDQFGLYYKEMLPFAIIGFLYCSKLTLTSIREKRFHGAAFCMISLSALVYWVE